MKCEKKSSSHGDLLGCCFGGFLFKKVPFSSSQELAVAGEKQKLEEGLEPEAPAAPSTNVPTASTGDDPPPYYLHVNNNYNNVLGTNPLNIWSCQEGNRPPLSNKASNNFPNEYYIYDKESDTVYLVGKLLGKGGFAKCYELTDTKTQKLFAGKIISKLKLTKPRQKEKILHEISLHSSLHHDHVVDFHDSFEDDCNVYIILEHCSQKSLVHILKTRQKLVEAEVRYYLVQLLDGIRYVHSEHVVHRDLKLGNMLLDEDMRIKIADFGLATKLEYPGEKKMTVCGTPNYIAPEVLQKKGHGYEVDIWAVGCIMYALLCGRPPFETHSLKETYLRITTNRFHVPNHVSQAARKLIVRLLHPDPAQRPSLSQILMDDFFTSYFTPKYLPTSCCEVEPKFNNKGLQGHFAMLTSHNQSTLRKNSFGYSSSSGNKPQSRTMSRNSISNEIKKMELVECGKNITRKPSRRMEKVPLAVESPAQADVVKRDFVKVPFKAEEKLQSVNIVRAEREESSKVRGPSKPFRKLHSRKVVYRKPSMPASSEVAGSLVPTNFERYSKSIKMLEACGSIVNKENDVNSGKTGKDFKRNKVVIHHPDSKTYSEKTSSCDSFGISRLSAIRLYRALTHCLETMPQDSSPNPIHDSNLLWVTKWVDYSNKYGFGFQLSDMSVGILFNDTTRMVLSPDGRCLTYNDLSNRTFVYATNSAPKEHRKKVTLLLYFNQYMDEHLIHGAGAIDKLAEFDGAADSEKKMLGGRDLSENVFMKKWFRTDKAIIMHLSNGTLQVNFFDDHTKLILSIEEQDYLATYIDNQRESASYRLLSITNFGCRNEISERLKYARRMLEGVINLGEESV